MVMTAMALKSDRHVSGHLIEPPRDGEFFFEEHGDNQWVPRTPFVERCAALIHDSPFLALLVAVALSAIVTSIVFGF